MRASSRNRKENQYTSGMFLVSKKKVGKNSGFILMYKGAILKTPAGNDFCYGNGQLLEAIASEVVRKQRMDETVLSLYSLFCTYVDYSGGADFVSVEENTVRDVLYADSSYLKAVHYCTTKFPTSSEIGAALFPISHWFSSNRVAFVKPLEVWQIVKMERDAIAEHDKDCVMAVQFVQRTICMLGREEKTALINLNSLTDMFVPALLLIIGVISPLAYAKMIVAAKVGDSMSYPFPELDRYGEEISSHRQSAQTIRRFLSLVKC